MIADRINNDLTPQKKILNRAIPILMYFLTFTHQKQGTCHKTLAT